MSAPDNSSSREQPELFAGLPVFPTSLPDDELVLLGKLPEYGENQCVQEVDPGDEAPCRRLAKRGLVKIHRWRDDPAGIGTTMYAGKLPTSGLRQVAA